MAELSTVKARCISALIGACLVVVALAPAGAQGPPSGFDAPGAVGLTPDLIRTIDVQKALIWTGHYDAMVDGDFGKRTRSGVASWQQDNGLRATGELTPQNAMTLIAAGARIRDALQWSTYRNDRVGYSIGYASRFFRPGKALANGGMEFAALRPDVSLSIIVGTRAAADDFARGYETMSASSDAYQVHYKARTDNWFVVAGTNEARTIYQRFERRPSGVVGFILTVPRDDPERLWVMIGASANSFAVGYDVQPDASPDRTTPPVTAPTAAPPAASFADRSGRTGSIELRLAGQDPELKAPQVFERVSGAVYIVAALSTQPGARDPDVNQGSAVAVSRQELLTNCHVVRGAHAVILMREDQLMRANVVSGDVEADRCVLRVQQPLPTFVRVRPYSNIKIGEPVYAIGAPRGFELTLTQGLVSSKRTLDGRRYVQTDAPISPGSSGGGLFDVAGNLLGVTTFFRKDSQNLNFAIPAEDYMR